MRSFPATLMLLAVLLLGCLGTAASWASDPTELGVDPELVVGPPISAPRAAAEAEAMAESIAGRMRCPVCQGLSVGDSPTEAARHMYGQIEELAALGFSEDQIFSYFEESYGAFIRLEPRFEGITRWVWILPILVFVLGLLGLGRAFAARRSSSNPRAAEEEADLLPAREVPEALLPFLQRVRAETRPPAGEA